MIRPNAFSSSRSGMPPRACLLSNGRYTVMASATGSGFSHWRDLALTRWREDATVDAAGSYVVVRNHDTGDVWSVTAQPFGTLVEPDEMRLVDGRVEYAGRHGAIDATLAVTVANDVDGELRRITLRNDGDSRCAVDVMSYAELVLGFAAADAAHPAFSKLFVQTQWAGDASVLLANRRRRSPDEPALWAAHYVVADPAHPIDAPEYETDRARFLGRGRSVRNARAFERTLSNTVGTVLDPVFAIRRRVELAPGESARVAFWTIAGESRDAVLAACAAHAAPDACDRAFADAGARDKALCARLGIGADESALLRRLAAPLLIADPLWRAPAALLARGEGGAPVLWAKSISGDRPIVLMRVADEQGLGAVSQLLRAQRYWQSMGVGVDIVLSSVAPLQAALEAQVSVQGSHLAHDFAAARAEAFVIVDSEISDALRDGLATVARIVCDAADGGLDARDPAGAPLAAAPAVTAQDDRPPDGVPVRTRPCAPSAPDAHDEPLAFHNGLGGFAVREREYVIHLDNERCTPAPWINILANPSFGCFVSAEGSGCTWSINSQQNPLTPWPNDPVTDAPREAIYLRDDDSGDLWSATAQPVRVPAATYEARHGKGYSRFTHHAYGIDVSLTVCVPLADGVRLSRVRLANRSGRPRQLSLTAYVEWALTPNGSVAAPFVVTSVDAKTGALFARNAWRAEFGARVAFLDLSGAQHSRSGDRSTFVGRLGTLARPAALQGSTPLDGRVGAGLDPCGALRMSVALPPDHECDIVLMLGDEASAELAQSRVLRYRSADFEAVLADVRAAWDATLDVVQVRTPDRALDVMLNDWLLYQTLACRLWARTAYYQASGAYGFRDQLQDVMALCVARPAIAREHLLVAASRQFAEGDVQHWWLPPAGRGIRTRMTDDRAWLPYVATHYLDVTGDYALLDEPVSFIAGPPLQPGENEAFFEPGTGDAATFYEHCARAIDVSLGRGAHGLPLMGTGDWNDGMNRVGIGGRGESVWLAWFLLATIDALRPIAVARGDEARAAAWLDYACAVRAALEVDGWDGARGEWYRRGYYDDGTPLGSRDSAECRIDAIAQSWSVIASAADSRRPARAMAAVDEQLILRDARIALLFTPPFDCTEHDPGYIKGYPPGIRENGGQYTHGAIWSIFAFARLGQGDRAGELFALLNPVGHTATPADVERYRVEPYVVCADVYSVAPHVGRGGWTWYTGSAGWLYRAGLEAILGFRLCGNTLIIDPCVPASWPGYQIDYLRNGADGTRTRYTIAVDNAGRVHRGVAHVESDPEGSVELDAGKARILLRDDGRDQRVRVVLG